MPDGLFHVISRGVDRGRIVHDDVDAEAFDRLMRATAVTLDWEDVDYCLMPNHFHVVLKASVPRLSGGMHRINGLYAQRFNRRHDRTGHVFESRFRAFVLDDEDHAANVRGYVLDNARRAGLCVRAEDWPWAGRGLGWTSSSGRRRRSRRA